MGDDNEPPLKKRKKNEDEDSEDSEDSESSSEEEPAPDSNEIPEIGVKRKRESK